jgi:hypothetical protein
VRVGHALPFRFYKEHIRSLGEVQGELGASPRESWDETLLSDRSCVVVSVDREWLGEDSGGDGAKWMPRHFR